MSPEGLVSPYFNPFWRWLAPVRRRTRLFGRSDLCRLDCGFEGCHRAFVSFIECLITFMLRPKERTGHYLLGNDGDVCAAPPLPDHPGWPNRLSIPSGSSQLMTTWSNRSSSNCTRKPLGWL